LLFRNNRNPVKEAEVIEIKAIGPDNNQVPKNNAVKIMYHPKRSLASPSEGNDSSREELRFLSGFSSAPSVLAADKDVHNLIIGPQGDGRFDAIFDETIAEAAGLGVTTQQQACDWIAQHIQSWSSRNHKPLNVRDRSLRRNSSLTWVNTTRNTKRPVCLAI
jgi:hypothetical protein